jgi:hypothetical protein
VRLIFSSPCPDTLTATLHALATDERYTILLTAPESHGRWGERISVPLAFANPRSIALDSFTVVVNASPMLLDPTGNVMGYPGVTATVRSYDRESGALEIHLDLDETIEPLRSADTLVEVEFDVLRGSMITSTLDLMLFGLPNNTEGRTSSGSFALDDFCDAHGRLLHVTGDIELKQNVPNPFNPTTVIEYETAFAGPVLLTVHDGIGREVLRLVDREEPAGRRQIVLDARDLASGVYTYRLQTGLQVLTRRMIVTR